MKRQILSFLLVAFTLTSLISVNQAAAQDKEQKKKKRPDVVYVPTPNDVVAKMLQMAKLDKKDTIYDLGCGDGRIVVTAAKKYGCKGIGFDINPVRIKESLDNVKKHNVKELVEIKNEDIFTVNLSKASVIALYLLPKMNEKLIPQFQKLKPGSHIVAHDYDMNGRVKPDKTITMTSKEDGVEHIIYLWVTPLKVLPPKAKEKKS